MFIKHAKKVVHDGLNKLLVFWEIKKRGFTLSFGLIYTN